MNAAGPRVSSWNRLGALAQRLIGIADEPTDDDDLRLRKRVVRIIPAFVEEASAAVVGLAERLEVAAL